MSVQVRIPTVLRPRVGGQQVVAAEGATVAQVLAHIEAAHPGFGPMVVEADGSLKRFVNVFLGDEDVRYLQGLATPVPDGATLVILPAVAGAEVATLTAAVGHTPLVPLRALSPRPGISLYAKLEWHNPTGSVKDRPALWMLDAAERDALVAPGDSLIEPSSGNTGIALARLARLRGYRMTVVVPDDVGEERKALLRAFGAELVESPGERGSNGAVELATDIASAGRHTMLFQYANPANPQAHYEGTGPEILEQVGKVDAFVSGLGTGGTLMGVGRALREAHLATRVIAAAPPAGESVLGLRSLEDGFVPPVFDPAAVDARILVGTAEAVAATRRLLAEEGLFAGISSGAALHAALRWAERMEEGTIVVLFADAGWKYLSSGVWQGTVDEAAARLNGRSYW